MRWAVTCVCGMTRLLPQDLKFGQKVTLTPCMRCGNAPTFRYWKWFVWRVS